MLNILLRLFFWSVAFLAIALLPLGVALLGEVPEGRGFLIEFGVGIGLVGFSLLALQFFTTSRLAWVAPYFGSDAELQFHRTMGILAMFFILAHPLILFLADPKYLEFLDPSVNFLRAVFLSLATVAVILLVVLPLWRVSFGLNYEWWRLTHGGLAALVIGVGMVHSLQVGHYVSGIGKQALLVGATALTLYLVFHTRVVKPLTIRRTPWRVDEVEFSAPDVYVLSLKADGHEGMDFVAGQYAWITVGDTPFSLQQHPFTFCSSASEKERVQFGIKDLGDFTSSIKDLEPGTKAFLEGPYGAFVLDPAAEGAVFVVGGIGVTPAVSILRTCRDLNYALPLILIYANTEWKEVAFREEIESLETALDLQIIHVLNEPHDGWKGESGYVTDEVLERSLTQVKNKDMQYLVCGPTPMMDMVEKELANRGVPDRRITTERFDIV